MFDWQRFLDTRHIDYITAGANVSKGNVAIRCPFCGASDESHHLGISLAGRGWGCWRNHSHRGKAPERLVVALIGCTWEEACRITGRESHSLGTADSLAQAVEALKPRRRADSLKPIEYPESIRPLTSQDRGRAAMFYDYLIDERLYHPRDVGRLVYTYSLHHALAGPFAYRLIFPAMMDFGLACWSGRAINENGLRYRALSADPEKSEKSGLPQAALSIDRTLFNFKGLLTGGRVLVLCEGPFDAMRVDFFLGGDGIRATCLWGKGVSQEQLYLLERLHPRFEKRYFILDPDAQFDVLATADRLRFLGFDGMSIPRHFKDPAEMYEPDLRRLFHLQAA